MGEEIIVEDGICSYCGMEATHFCDDCKNWHCLDCFNNEIYCCECGEWHCLNCYSEQNLD